MQRLHQLLELDDLAGRYGACPVAGVRREITQGRIAPVVRQAQVEQSLLGRRLVHRHQLDRREAQSDEVIQDGRTCHAWIGPAQRRRHPGVPPALRGTYPGMASPAVLDHLVGLGISAVELMPVHQSASEQRLIDLGLTNYWGYSTLGYFAPHAGYRAGSVAASQVVQFKQLVKALHQAGIEVLLDVVYNHTGEGTADEPAITLRGLANEKYYRLDPDDPSRYADCTGTGNTLNVDRREVLRLIMDSLRYWVTDMHVDGFR